MRKPISALLLCVMAMLASAAPQVTLQGELIQGGLVIGQAPPGSRIWLNDTVLKQTPDGYFVFGLDRDAASGDVLKLVTEKGETWQQTLQVKPREYRIQRIEGIDQAIVSDDKTPEEWQRIRDESAQVATARRQHIESQAFRQAFRWPATGRISGVFGSQRVYNGKPGRPHYGVDIAAPTGTPVYAPVDGVVTLAHDDMYYSGGTLILDHGYGISSSFLHLSKVLVKVGDQVQQGDLIAEIGAGGRATGPHLDWRMNWYRRQIDPQLLVPDMKTLLQSTQQEHTK